LFRIQKLEKDGKIIVLLSVGDKSTQERDIKKSKEIWKKLNEKKMGISKFEIADYLDSKEMIAEYLNTALEEGDNDDIINAIGHVAKAIGMTKIAQETGMSRSSLYKSLSEGAKPQFSTIMKVLKAIGGQIQVNPKTA
jgi:probable addiction module antidote protein